MNNPIGVTHFFKKVYHTANSNTHSHQEPWVSCKICAHVTTKKTYYRTNNHLPPCSRRDWALGVALSYLSRPWYLGYSHLSTLPRPASIISNKRVSIHRQRTHDHRDENVTHNYSFIWKIVWIISSWFSIHSWQSQHIGNSAWKKCSTCNGLHPLRRQSRPLSVTLLHDMRDRHSRFSNAERDASPLSETYSKTKTDVSISQKFKIWNIQPKCCSFSRTYIYCLSTKKVETKS